MLRRASSEIHKEGVRVGWTFRQETGRGRKRVRWTRRTNRDRELRP
jgi:hypothetical protein